MVSAELIGARYYSNKRVENKMGKNKVAFFREKWQSINNEPKEAERFPECSWGRFNINSCAHRDSWWWWGGGQDIKE